ncbi:MAG: hypothetical protein KDD02_10215 [Phaeodactylibacter sp.]|nr:hypothetical protein [Phaeodactylibacter sp.]MCB9299442.1 hypothetical protein [Lewinellaceae bacterium]
MNPNDILKQQFLLIVDNQLRDNSPPETAQTLRRLQAEGYSAQEAKLLISQCVSVEVVNAMQFDKPYNNERYVRNLNKLPGQPTEE